MTYLISNVNAERVGRDVILTWLYPPVEKVNHFRVYKNGILVRDHVTLTNFFDKNVKKGESYSYSVTFIDQNGLESSHSKEISIML